MQALTMNLIVNKKKNSILFLLALTLMLNSQTKAGFAPNAGPVGGLNMLDATGNVIGPLDLSQGSFHFVEESYYNNKNGVAFEFHPNAQTFVSPGGDLTVSSNLTPFLKVIVFYRDPSKKTVFDRSVYADDPQDRPSADGFLASLNSIANDGLVANWNKVNIGAGNPANVSLFLSVLNDAVKTTDTPDPISDRDSEEWEPMISRTNEEYFKLMSQFFNGNFATPFSDVDFEEFAKSLRFIQSPKDFKPDLNEIKIMLDLKQLDGKTEFPNEIESKKLYVMMREFQRINLVLTEKIFAGFFFNNPDVFNMIFQKPPKNNETPMNNYFVLNNEEKDIVKYMINHFETIFSTINFSYFDEKFQKEVVGISNEIGAVLDNAFELFTKAFEQSQIVLGIRKGVDPASLKKDISGLYTSRPDRRDFMKVAFQMNGENNLKFFAKEYSTIFKIGLKKAKALSEALGLIPDLWGDKKSGPMIKGLRTALFDVGGVRYNPQMEDDILQAIDSNIIVSGRRSNRMII